MLRIGIDTGGTFTDFFLLKDGQRVVLKLPSTAGNPQEALLEGLRKLLGEQRGYLLQHGSTVATNALLERKGAKTLLLTNQGFEDILEIGRQNRPKLYSLAASRPAPLVEKKYRVGVKTRLTWDGRELIALENKSLDWVKNKVEQLAPEAIAICLLYSFVRPDDELRIAAALEPVGVPISLSHQVLPEFREFERTMATVVNAYLQPGLTSYLNALTQDPLIAEGKLTIMQSNGGTVSAEEASRFPVRTLFSGPAGGVVGAFKAARKAGFDRIISFDMGGTSTDVCLCDGSVPKTREAMIGHYPIPVRTLDIHSVGAGGGSIAWVDHGGLLRVGPQSAGADPGPVCYGRGEQITVTDAHLFSGTLNPDWFLGGEFTLHPERVRPALENLAGELGQTGQKEWSTAEVAEGILRIVSTQMEGALRLISLERGYDTRDFTLVSYGGAGGLHACRLAESLLIPRVLVPSQPGLLSAQGILEADITKDASRTVLLDSRSGGWHERMMNEFEVLENDVRQRLQAEGFQASEVRLRRSADLRYVGQSFEINIAGEEATEFDWIGRFHELHNQLYGYSNPQLPVEVVTVRAEGSGRLPQIEADPSPLEAEQPALEALLQERQVLLGGETVPTRFYLRHALRAGNRIEGPAVVLEYSSTTLIPAGWAAAVDEWLNLVIEASS